jgi:hypothetical protein
MVLDDKQKESATPTERRLGGRPSSSKSHPINVNQVLDPSSLKQRQKAALENYENLRSFYQAETLKYSRWYILLQVVTLTGAALTPILLLIGTAPRVVQALPSALGGLAAALNASFQFRQDWADNYYALSALMNEYDRFSVRTSPDYNGSEIEALDTFQNRVSLISMSEVASWRDLVKRKKEQK